MASSVPTFLNTAFFTSGLSRDFYELLAHIGDANTKEEEGRYIDEEIETLKTKLGQPDVPSAKMKEYVTRLIHCNMLGRDVDFGIIHAIMLTQSAERVEERRTGYIACSLLLTENHELTIMLVNTLQRDLKRTNYLDVCSVLNALCQISHPEIVGAVLDSVVALLDYPKEIVRKKSITVLHRFNRLYPQLVSHLDLDPAFRKALMDKDPSVVAASLNLWKDLAEKDPSRHKDLVPVFVGILQQTIERRLHRSYDYHGVPAPWAQVRCLQVLAALAKEDESASEQIAPVVLETLRQAEKGVDAAFAIVLESIRTLAHLHPKVLDPLLSEDSTEAVHPLTPLHRFMSSHNHNLHYLGLLCLEQIPVRFWSEEWRGGGVVAESLVVGGGDGTVTRKAMNLLDKIVSSTIIEAIATCLLRALPLTRRDCKLQREMATWFIGLADANSPGHAWYLGAMVMTLAEAGKVLEEGEFVEGKEDGGDTVERVCKAMENSLVAETETTDLRRGAVNLFYRVLTRRDVTSVAPLALLKLAVWTLGEYAYISSAPKELDVTYKLSHILASIQDESLQVLTIAAITKCVSRCKQCPVVVKKRIDKYKKAKIPEVQQACYEFLAVVEDFEFEQMVTTLDDMAITTAEGKTTGVEDIYFPPTEQQDSTNHSRDAHTRGISGSYTVTKDKGKARADTRHQDKSIRQSSIYSFFQNTPSRASSGRRHKASNDDHESADLAQQAGDSTVLFDGGDYVEQWPSGKMSPTSSPRSRSSRTSDSSTSQRLNPPRRASAPISKSPPTDSQTRVYPYTGSYPSLRRTNSGRPTAPNDGEAMLSSLIALELGDVPISPPSTISSFTTALSTNALSQQSIHTLYITTAQFGSLWIKLAAHHERKVRLPPAFPDNVDAAELAARVRAYTETNVGLRVVEIIGLEFIAAGQIGSKSGKDAVVLVHVKVSEGGEVEVTARAKSKEVVQLVVEKMKDVFGQ